MRIAIVGSGALGSVFGGFLYENGEDVHLVDVWEEHVRAIREDGLLIEGLDGEDTRIHPPVTTDHASVGEVDVVFVFTKAFDTERAARDARPLVGEETTVVTVQNGLSNVDLIRRHVPDERVLGGYALVGAEILGPGHVVHSSTGADAGKIGGPDPARVERVVDLLTDAGVDVSAVADPTPHIWDKQIYSVAFKPMAALLGQRVGPIGAFEPTMTLMEELVGEAVAVADATGIELPTDDPIAKLHRRVRELPGAKSSMLQDVEHERRTEIDYINGVIVDYGAEHGIETPYNRAVTALVKGRENAYLGE